MERMQGVFLKFGAWCAQKLCAAALIAAAAVLLYAAWMWAQEEGVLEARRLERLEQALAERGQLQAAQAALETKLEQLRRDAAAQKARLAQAEKVMATLRELESWWDRWFGNRAQQAANAEQLAKMEQTKAEARNRWSEAEKALSAAGWQLEGLKTAIGRNAVEVERIEAAQSGLRRTLLLAWEATKGWIAGVLAAYFLGPTLWAVFLYFGVATWLGRGRPVVLGPEPARLPEVGASRVSVEATLRPGDVLRIKEKFLQSSDEGLAKRTRFVLDWRIPLTSAACGLIELIELRQEQATGEYRATLSNGDDPHLELAIVEVPEGASLVLRPRFLAGVLQRADERLVIRRHWRIFRWQAWISGQFRYFEFVGPCRLVVAGSRGVRAERLAEREGVAAPARRTNQAATIAFTPNLEYRPVRAETFWSYYRGMNPLFDDLFAGKGLFVLQETAAPGEEGKPGRFWSGVWSAVLKVFGL